jgi:hypothetical protein
MSSDFVPHDGVWLVSESHKRAGSALRFVVDLFVKRRSVSLHMHPEEERVRARNRLIELPLDPGLGGRDPNFRLLRAMQTAAQEELERQGRNVA